MVSSIIIAWSLELGAWPENPVRYHSY